ncbi:hypothetical protein AYO38_08550 [bacterium SCGC AG-212-C10]|nr:hypothetical protein AYO38_08550 [bacterium SCGC AG-212-C10]
MDTARQFLGTVPAPMSSPFLTLIREQAANADSARTVDPAVIRAIKASDLIRATAVRSIGGVEASILDVASEMEAVAVACGSTAWCLWNHLCVFHLYCAQLGPDANEFLAGIVERREWVTFPNGAGTAMRGLPSGDDVLLSGKTTFGSGARYGDWASTIFAQTVEGEERPQLRFTVAPLAHAGVSIDPDWRSMSVRASATDTVAWSDVTVPAERTRLWRFDHTNLIRNPEMPVIAHRYREDWVGLAVLWLAAQGVGITQAALEDATVQASQRRAIFNVKMADRPGVQFNLAHAAANIAAARATYQQGCRETDERIESGVIPDEPAYLRQLGLAMVALRLCSEAMERILHVLGGNGLREEGSFERRYRDFQAMPIHITVHPDRVAELCGKFLLGVS